MGEGLISLSSLPLQNKKREVFMMLYYEFNVSDKTYKLRLTTRDIVELEKKLGCNPLAIFGNGDTLPTLTQMISVLHSSLQSYQHNMSLNDTYDVFDAWLADNHTLPDFVNEIIEIYKVSGIIRETEENEKN